jgi:hypothetical protein
LSLSTSYTLPPEAADDVPADELVRHPLADPAALDGLVVAEEAGGPITKD